MFFQHLYGSVYFVQTLPYKPNIVNGCTASSGMKPPAPGTGPAGTAPPPNNSASAASSTTRKRTRAIGPKTSTTAKNTVGVSPLHPHTQTLANFLQIAALCNDDANGNVPLGKSCNRYWQCQGGYPRLQRCPAMLVFDRRSLRCVVPPTEDCDVPTTIPPPPAEEDGEQNIPQNIPQQQGGRDFPNLPAGAVPVQVVAKNNRPRN